VQTAANISQIRVQTQTEKVARGRQVLLICIVSICIAMLCSGGSFAAAQADRTTPSTAQSPAPEVAANRAKPELLDSVIAVVNNQVVLASDLELEQRVFRLLPIGDRSDATPAKALERLTTRALIEQQILLEDPHGLEIAPKDLEDSLAELRQNLPGCKQRDCVSNTGWAAYLTTLGLTPERVTNYWTHRMAVLRFIELRFRSGNRVTPEEIQKYYQESLVPKYAKPGDAPPLDKVSPRIQEILLQQKVNALLNDWLKSLQDQGQVEILDPALKASSAAQQVAPDSGAPNQGAGSGSGPGEGGKP
jgi:peptidyl-prolyl cis-trans isomerase SurA